MIFKIFSKSAIILSAFAVTSAYAAQYYVDAPTGNAEQPLLEICKSTLSDTLTSLGENEVTNVSQADFELTTNVEKINNTVFITLSKKSPKENNLLTKKTMKGDADKIDEITQKLAQTVLGKSSPQTSSKSEPANNTSVQSINKPLLSNKTTRFWKLGIGGAGLYGLKDKNGNDGSVFGYSANVGWSAQIPNSQASVNIESILTWGNTNNGMYAIGIGPQYAFLEGDTSPYVKATASFFSAGHEKGDSTGGLALTSGIGMEFFRGNDVKMFTEADLIVGMKTMNSTLPMVSSFLIGVLF